MFHLCDNKINGLKFTKIECDQVFLYMKKILAVDVLVTSRGGFTLQVIFRTVWIQLKIFGVILS